MAAMTCAASCSTLADSHFPLVTGPGRTSWPGAGRMSPTVRTAGTESNTLTTSAIRLRLLFSPADRRVVSFLLAWALAVVGRSEEHTSELQSRPHLVCRLLLEKKKPSPHPISFAQHKKIKNRKK